MARIPDAELERIKANLSLQRLVEADGIALTRRGADYHGHCPFHDDDSPSLVISPKTNLYHCFGCGAAGSVIDWVMQRQGLSFRYAVEQLRQDLSPLAATPNPNPAAPLVNPDEAFDEQALLQRVVTFYHQTLKQSPDALAYLDKRGLADPALIDQFQLGYANRSLGYRLPPKQVKAGAELRGQLQQLGILRTSGHEHFNGSLVIPVIDGHGQVTELYGRKIGERLRPGTPLHLYLPGPHQGIFNASALEASPEIILCESLIDALTFWAAGYRNVTTAYGVEGFTDELLQTFIDHQTKRVLIAFDRDAAGDRGADKIAQRLMTAGIDVFRLQFPHGLDANDYACQRPPAHDSLGLVIRKAHWLGNGKPPTIETAAKEKTPLPTLAADPDNEPASTPLPASPLPPMQPPNLEATVSDHEITLTLDTRRYRIRGLAKNTTYDSLKINLLVSTQTAVHLDTFDLYHAKQRQSFIRAAAIELGLSDEIIKHDLAQLLLKLEQLQDQHIQATLTPKLPIPAELSDTERTAALALLRDPNLAERIVTDVEACGLVGEATNVLVGYLATVSRKLRRPLAVIVQSSSAAGKSSLMDAILDLIPDDERVQYSAMTGQSLFYLGEQDLQHKVLAIAEEEGVKHAAYALKLLQSEGELTIASTGKDEATGNLVTKDYRVQGPVMLFLTTTAIEIDDELLNRCLVLTVNESRQQTQAIHQRQRQRRTLAGLLTQQHADTVIDTHRNAQRLLRPLAVVNPYADQLTFLDDQTRTRRDHEKYLTLIDAIALLHQHQREIKTVVQDGAEIDYIEASVDDIALANRLAHEVLGRSLDELPPQTRRLLAQLVAWVTVQTQAQGIDRRAYRFSRRQVREATRLSDTQVRVHLARLVELEYLLVHRGQRGQSFVYELLFDGDLAACQPHLPQLIDVKSLATTQSSRGETATSRGQRGPNAAGSRLAESASKPINTERNAKPRGSGPSAVLSVNHATP